MRQIDSQTSSGERHERTSPRGVTVTFMACALVALAVPTAQAQRTRRNARAATPAPAVTAPVPNGTTSVATAPAAQNFQQVAAQAGAAREADRQEEAVALYRRAVALRPDWAEGWWYLGTLHYGRDEYAEAARAFKQTARLQPKSGPPLALLGLCEFQLGQYGESFTHIQQARALGVGDNAELTHVMRYHEALLSILQGEFERGQQTLGSLSYEGLKTENLVIAHGLAALRRGMLPREVTPNYPDRDLIRRIGLAEHLAAQKNVADAQREYELLVRDFAKSPGVYYSYGRFLLINRDDEGALAAFLKEIENYPKHALARIQIGYIKLKNRDAAGGLPYAEEAVKLYPRLPLSHFVLGRLLLDAGQQERAIQELEIAQRMVPDYAPLYFQLSRAYSKANRKADAERARAVFLRLSKQGESSQQQQASQGMAGVDDNAEAAATTEALPAAKP